MANMFSKNEEKKVPKNLADCYQSDAVTTNLWMWSARLERWGEIAFGCIIIIGFVLSIVGAISTVEVEHGVYNKYTTSETRFSFMYFITALLKTASYAIIEYVSCHVGALLVGSLADIVQHTRITANIALYQAHENKTEQSTNMEDCDKAKPASDTKVVQEQE